MLDPLVLSKFERILALRKYRRIVCFPSSRLPSRVPRSVFLGGRFSFGPTRLRRATGTMAPCPSTAWDYPNKPACLLANAKDLQVNACCHLCSCTNKRTHLSVHGQRPPRAAPCASRGFLVGGAGVGAHGSRQHDCSFAMLLGPRAGSLLGAVFEGRWLTVWAVRVVSGRRPSSPVRWECR